MNVTDGRLDDDDATERINIGPIDDVEFQTAEALAAIDEARQQGRPAPIAEWIERCPAAAARLREAAPPPASVAGAIAPPGPRGAVASPGPAGGGGCGDEGTKTG